MFSLTSSCCFISGITSTSIFKASLLEESFVNSSVITDLDLSREATISCELFNSPSLCLSRVCKCSKADAELKVPPTGTFKMEFQSLTLPLSS